MSRKPENNFVKLTIFILLFLLSSVSSAPLSAATLTVAAAADMASAEKDLTSSFHEIYPSDQMRFVFAASGALSQQIANGAPYDVFLSANEQFVDQLAAARKVLPDTVHVYALGELGILWRDGKSHQIKDLQEAQIRLIAIANPKLAPYGAAAREALEHEHLWETVQSKVVFGENVRQTLQILESGNADAVLTAFSLMIGRPGASVIPSDWHKPIRQKAGVIAASSNVELARKFLAFLQGPGGSAILRRHGLNPAK